MPFLVNYCCVIQPSQVLFFWEFQVSHTSHFGSHGENYSGHEAPLNPAENIFTLHACALYLYEGCGRALKGAAAGVSDMELLSLMWAVCPSVHFSCNTFDSIKYVRRIYWLKNHKGLTKTLTPDHLMCSPGSKGIHLRPPGFLFYHGSPQTVSLHALVH